MDLGLKGLNALVTGGTKGIGRRAADIFASEGANVAICARNKSEVDEAVTALGRTGVKSFGQAVDVGEKEQLEGWIAAGAKALGGIDILVANVSALAVDQSDVAADVVALEQRRPEVTGLIGARVVVGRIQGAAAHAHALEVVDRFGKHRIILRSDAMRRGT